ncbi:MAG: NTP transferase domain-containing protein [Chloroflexi bacterium]|nr:NTP transferase domain-containing protein [Chloroflexota bacterium]
MRALVLAGGLGTRLRSVVGAAPKALAPVGGRPFLHYLLAQLQRNGFDDVTVCTGYGADAVRSFVGSGATWGLRVDCSDEPQPLGTGGAIRLAIGRHPDKRFVVLNGDSFFDIVLADLIAAHEAMAGLVTLAACRLSAAGRFGTVDIGPDGDVRAFREKDQAGPAEINAGVYVLERAAVEGLPAGTPISLERDIFPSLIAPDPATGRTGRLRATVYEAFFADIGIPADHAAIDRDPRPLLGRPVPC